MKSTRMTMPRYSGLSLFLLVALAGCAALPSASVTTNVPSDRLSHETYPSPDGGYTVTLPHLIQPGARIEERQVSPEQYGVRFSDDSGKAYRIVRIDNTGDKFTIEQL
jgi:hypothetical protein